MTSTTASAAPAAPTARVDGGAYDVIKARLDAQAKTLTTKVEALNARRLEVFGKSELAVLGNERVRTENNCVPRDITNVGGRLFFAYNVFIGLRTTTRVEDVFALHTFAKNDDGTLSIEPVSMSEDTVATSFLRDAQFKKDFDEIYRYYKDARLVQLRRTDSGRVLAVFQVGAGERDVKVLRWAIGNDGTLKYLDARGVDDHVFPPTHSFEWTKAGREQHVTGRHPHVNILDEVFVETIGGDLTVKVENNTATGKGIYSELVDDKNQSLDDAQVFYAKVGSLILLKVLPFRESTWRHLVFNTRTKEVVRIDAIAASCVELPEDHGIIFPGGYALTTGEVKTFDVEGAANSTFYKAIKSDNGEDVLYVFYEAKTGRRLLLPYNLIDKEVRTPIVAHGWSLFDDGTLIAFRAESEEPTRLHPMRVWQTPYLAAEVAQAKRSTSKHQGSLLHKTGNAEAVRAVSDVLTIRRMIGSSRPTLRNYEDLITQTTRLLDAYPWLGNVDEAQDLRSTLVEVKATSELVIDEFQKVIAIEKAAAENLRLVEEAQKAIFLDIRLDAFSSIDPFVQLMGRLRTHRGRLITLREERSIDLARLTVLENEVAAKFDEVTERAGRFLMGDAALLPYEQQHDAAMAKAAEAKRAADVSALIDELVASTQGLQLLTEITGQLKIDDANARTAILEGIAAMLSKLNRGRAILEAQKKKLLTTEGSAEFAAQMRLFGSAVESALSMCDTPERTDAELARLLVAIEELEGRFAEFSDFLVELTKKRDEVFEALSARKQQLLDERNRRAQNLQASAERILDGVKRRAASMKSIDELNAAFAGDPMIAKVRSLADELFTLGDAMKAEEVRGRLKATREDATRTLRDKLDIFVDGGDLIQLGQHRFAVNKQPFDLTMLPRTGNDGRPQLFLHITGTEYFESVDDTALNELRDLWDETLVSEDATVARAEYLAASVLFAALDGVEGAATLSQLAEAQLKEGELLGIVSTTARARYDEGYERGVHDADATALLDAMLTLRRQAGVLSHSPKARALAALYVATVSVDEAQRTHVTARLRSIARLSLRFADSSAARERVLQLAAEIKRVLASAVDGVVEVSDDDARAAADAAIAELGISEGAPTFVVSGDAKQLTEELFSILDKAGERDAFERDLQGLSSSPAEQLATTLGWLRSLIEAAPAGSPLSRLLPAVFEAAVVLVTRGKIERTTSAAMSSTVVTGLFSSHARVVDRSLEVRLDEVLPRLRRFCSVRVPRFVQLKARRQAVIDERRVALRLNEFQPRVLSSFVRNKLINDVYLHLVGNNLAKQMGAAGDKKRADLMGMLLLISPPGYGKTTLMEYVASRLGLFYVKVNGPSLGHSVTSLDPNEAPDATARQEVEKLNFAFELGNNVLLLIDDIQHTSPELLQKFISLCDGTRRVEGVWRGRTRTYDLRGKRFVVCMAGNPYTETGEKFRIPDMLANRADTWNLGDVSGSKADLFAMSFIENALTANVVTQPLAGRDPADVHLLLRIADGESVPTTDLKHAYSSAELDEIVRVLKMLRVAQSALVKVNATYVSSAATDDRFRTEPPFKLQGSYRNMAKLAQGIVPVMNPNELERLIDDHYQAESQTLTTGAEANLLKLAELRGRMSETQQARWADIRKNFERLQLQGDSTDPASRVAATLAALTQRIESIGEVINAASKATIDVAVSERAENSAQAAQLAAHSTEAMQIAALQVQQALTTTLVPVTKALEQWRADTIAFSQAQAQARVQQRTLDEKRADERARMAAAVDPAVLTALERVSIALQQAQLAVTVHNPANPGISELVRLQTMLIEQSLVPLAQGLSSSLQHEHNNAARLDAVLTSLRTIESKGLVGVTGNLTATSTHRPFAPKPQVTRAAEDDE